MYGMLSFIYHAAVIRSAIISKTNVGTTSYVSPAMLESDAAAKEAGTVVLNGVGVDPGIDHLYAIRTIGEVHANGGKVKEFHSYCGGLPAPGCADNPLKYIFSWSPRGAILSQRNPASFILNGKQVDIAVEDLMNRAEPRHGWLLVRGLSYNRNSIPFRESYNIPEAETILRGSLRYGGYSKSIKAFADIGWSDTANKDWLKPGLTWAQIHQKITGASDTSESSIVSCINAKCKFPSKAERKRIISSVRHFGLFSSEQVTIRGENLLDTLCGQLEKLLSFKRGERDLVMLPHKFVVEWTDGKKDTRTYS
ncbi:hypothetical protein MMC15_007271 [Xylographa vitiligo]|nr:hypothetical protein [Xylographa vitiligo]